jgi:uncharacterized membrane protein YhaH (DUF805 family)
MFDLKLVFARSLTFGGYASRSEFWTGYLALIVLGIPVFLLDKVFNQLAGNLFANFWLGYAESFNLAALIYGQGGFSGLGTAIYLTFMPGAIQLLFSLFATVFVAASSTRRLRDSGWFPHLYLLVIVSNLGSAVLSLLGANRMASFSTGQDVTQANFLAANVLTFGGVIASLLALAAVVIWLVGVSLATKPRLS